MIAHLTNEVIAIYPITPASPMGEWADEWSSQLQKNLWGSVPDIIEMQSEGGAAGAIHGALQAGALTTTFTASQGLLLMIPNMYKIAGELTPSVFHVASRSLACQALSIFGDHSDVMAARSTGFGLLASNSPQEVHDFALIAQACTLQSRIPLLHFFDGFRTSHEINRISIIDHDTASAMMDDKLIEQHRLRALSPDHPILRGSSQNPDIYFQARETVNPYYQAMPAIMQACMDQFAKLTGRQYRLFDYVGHEQAERVMILMGSGAEATRETIDYLNRQGEKVGAVIVRLYRPFDATALLDSIPGTANRVTVLDRTKEPGADGEPLYKDVITAIARDVCGTQTTFTNMPVVTGGRYGLSSKEFTPGMIKAVLDELSRPAPKNNYTIGIHDDVSQTSLSWDTAFRTDAHDNVFQAVFYGLGSDGTVSANKNSIKIIGDKTGQYAQGYFVYDSKKSGAVTVSHLRFGPEPIHSTYLIAEDDAGFVACHQPAFLQRHNMLDKAAEGAVFLLNTPTATDQVWDTLPRQMQEQIRAKRIRVYVIDAYSVANNNGMGQRINTIMQTCFFSISGILPQQQAIDAIKQAVEKTYGKKGQRIIDMNHHAIDDTLDCLHEITIPETISSQLEMTPPVPADAPDFVQQVTGKIISGYGNDVPVSALSADGSFPLGTAAYEKRNLALEIPIWDNELCTQCGKCPFVCPHGVIRSKVFPASHLKDAPATFKAAKIKGKDYPQDMVISYQVSTEDCTGCGLCVEICPIRDKSNASHKALNMDQYAPLKQAERANWTFFLDLPDYPRDQVKPTTMKGSMLFQPLFEFSGACVGCGETPYLKLASQLFGDRMLVANATGCSSIYGGNLPTTPWTVNQDGRGPAWSNSLFEDNAEFGLGMRTALNQQSEQARDLLKQLSDKIEPALMDAILNADESTEAGIQQQRERIIQLKETLSELDQPLAKRLEVLADMLCRKSVWIIGGDGWAYDIGFGGLDHVLASGQDVNILVLDTEVYSNTGGQTSKATPRGAVAKFSAGGKPTAKKDLALMAMDYQNVYIAHVAYAAKDVQTLRAFIEAEAHPGPSLIIAYAPCIAHGVDLSNNHRQQQLAVDSGHWPLFRYDPLRAHKGENPLHLDSKAPSIPYRDFVKTETRFNMLWRTHPQDAEHFLAQSQKEVNERYEYYQHLSEIPWHEADTDEEPSE